MQKSTSSGSVRSTSSSSNVASTSNKAVPSYMRTTAASQNKSSSTPRSKSQEDLRNTPAAKTAFGSRKIAGRQASTPVSKSKFNPPFEISSSSSIGSGSKPVTGNVAGTQRPGTQRIGALPSDAPRNFRRNIMSTMGNEAKGPVKAVPLRVPHKTADQPTALEEDMALDVKKAAIIQAMFLRNQAKKALDTAEKNAYCDRSYLWRCTKQIKEDIEKLEKEKKEFDCLTELAPHLKGLNESFDHLNSKLGAILKVLDSIHGDMNRRCSLVVLNGPCDVLSESTKKAIQDLLSNPAMGKRTTIKVQELELMCSQAVKMSELVSFIETLVNECQQLSIQAERKMNYASKFQKAIQDYQQSSTVVVKQETIMT